MTVRGRRVSILGVPSSAGSHNPGQEKAPAAWRAAGLADGLRQAGLDVEDPGDLPAAPFRPGRRSTGCGTWSGSSPWPSRSRARWPRS
jgi:arginase family enzyme